MPIATGRSIGSITEWSYSMITYLYHKRHKLTGLNYFGKTIRDPYMYNGSGIHWNRHLAKHGPNVETIQVWAFEDLAECSKFAIDFSIKHNIVESIEWANLINENGITGGYNQTAYTNEAQLKKSKRLKGKVRSKTTLEKMSASKKGLQAGNKNPMYGKKHTNETLAKLKVAKPKYLCYHCNSLIGGKSNYERWHGNNCKSKQSPY